MRQFIKYTIFGFCILMVSACAPAREDADAKLLKACKASVEAVSSSNEKIHKITAQTFVDKKSHDGLDLRVVTIKARVTVGDSAFRQKKYVCYFQERIGVFGIGYSVEFYRLDKSGRMYGNVDGTIMGDFNDNMKINQAVEKIFY